MISKTPDFDWDLVKSIFETLLEKLSSEIIFFYFCQRQFLQSQSWDLVFEIFKIIQSFYYKVCFKNASEQILVKIWCLKYKKDIQKFDYK